MKHCGFVGVDAEADFLDFKGRGLLWHCEIEYSAHLGEEEVVRCIWGRERGVKRSPGHSRWLFRYHRAPIVFLYTRIFRIWNEMNYNAL